MINPIVQIKKIKNTAWPDTTKFMWGKYVLLFWVNQPVSSRMTCLGCTLSQCVLGCAPAPVLCSPAQVIEGWWMFWKSHCYIVYTLCVFQWIEYRKLDHAHGVCWPCVMCGMAASILGPTDHRGRAQDVCRKRLLHHHHQVGHSHTYGSALLIFIFI